MRPFELFSEPASSALRCSKTSQLSTTSPRHLLVSLLPVIFGCSVRPRAMTTQATTLRSLIEYIIDRVGTVGRWQEIRNSSPVVRDRYAGK